MGVLLSWVFISFETIALFFYVLPYFIAQDFLGAYFPFHGPVPKQAMSSVNWYSETKV